MTEPHDEDKLSNASTGELSRWKNQCCVSKTIITGEARSFFFFFDGRQLGLAGATSAAAVKCGPNPLSRG